MGDDNTFKNERIEKFSFVFWFVAGAVLVGVDQLTKYLAFHNSFGVFLNTFSPWVRKFHYFNHNFAFSLPLPPVVIFILYAVILIAIAWYLLKHGQKLSTAAKVSWMLIVAGAVSNVSERVALGYVRDFVYIFSGIFNLADFYILLGVFTLLIRSLLRDKHDL